MNFQSGTKKKMQFVVIVNLAFAENSLEIINTFAEFQYFLLLKLFVQ